MRMLKLKRFIYKFFEYYFEIFKYFVEYFNIVVSCGYINKVYFVDKYLLKIIFYGYYCLINLENKMFIKRKISDVFCN